MVVWSGCPCRIPLLVTIGLVIAQPRPTDVIGVIGGGMKNERAGAPDLGKPLTPCVGVCRLDGRGLCVGCQRSLGEIANWGGLSDAERMRYIKDVLPLRKLR